MRRQGGSSILSFLPALAIASVMLAMVASMGTHLLRKAHDSEQFNTTLTDIVQSVKLAISDQWQQSGCRTLTEPPTLETLVSDYQASAAILSAPYAIDIDYRTEPNTHASSGVTIEVTLPDELSGFALKNAAQAMADDVFITQHSVTLYLAMTPISSSLQHHYFHGGTGCMQDDYDE